ncbi:MAG: hypothetical protein DYG91_06935 [Chloroflexi bacterium CFX7]|nr:hypothetical protein [Chloroflexi bacterium CFX7]MCK6565290.1 hypothetical protein [Dehalococcoidia bacterium]RIL04200.1 MAG: hypothetical protein DCC78_01065 [bacterium]
MQEITAEGTSAAGYTPRQRWAIVTAVSVLVAIMVGAAFSAGVYIGNNRELAPGTFAGAGAPPRQGQPGAPQPNGVAPGVPNQPAGQGVFDAVGVLQGVSNTALVVRGPEGPRTITYDAATQFMRNDGTMVRVAELRPGATLGLKLRPGVSPPTVDSVVVLPPAGAAQPAAQ